MFDINAADLPTVRTRRALLVLDLQNNLVDKDGIIPVERPSQLHQNVATLVPVFRQTGTIIWIKSHFEDCRPVNDGTIDCENVITDKQVIPVGLQQRAQSTQPIRNSKRLQAIVSKIVERSNDEAEAATLLGSGKPSLIEADEELSQESEEENSEENEVFLSMSPEDAHDSLQPGSSSCDLVQALQNVADPSQDMFFSKSHYSAFRSGWLLQTLRRQFITELFICGALTNISVFATAMDAARYGYAITLVEDCLGYRSKSRHDQSLRSLDESTGCDIFSSVQVMEDIQSKVKKSTKNEKTATKRPVRQNQGRETLDQMMEKLKLKSETNTASATEAKPPKGAQKNQSAASPPVKQEGSVAASNGSAASDESLPHIPRPQRAGEVNSKNRVQKKVLLRRRPSRSAPSDSSVATVESSSKVEAEPSKSSPSLEPAARALTPSLDGSTKSLEKKETKETKGTKAMTEKSSPDQGVRVEAADRKSTASPPTATTKAAEVASESEKPIVKPSEQQPPSVNDGTPSPVEGESICEGDTTVISNLIPRAEAEGIYETIKAEVQWQMMSHQGGEVPRLVAVQGEIASDGSIPIYRHPSDESPPLLEFSAAVSVIRREVEKTVGHPVNHCLIQLYRSGTDYISEHSDKTLDIVPDTYIANVSLGAQRTMTFRTKRPLKDGKPVQTEKDQPRSSCRAILPHNSLCRMSLVTNMRWLHSIRQDKRMDREKTPAELDYDGMRISLTFRLIGTFLDKDQTRIWGQGAVAKHKKHARRVVNGPTPEAQRMIEAFGTENRSSEFDWPAVYGQGFDVLHISNTRKLSLSGNMAVDIGVMAMLAHFGLEWTPSPLSAPASTEPGMAEMPLIKLVDTDISRSMITGGAPIFLYLDAVYGQSKSTRTPLQYARLFTRLHQAIALETTKSNPHALDIWETYAAEDHFIAGAEVSVADFAFWPVLHSVVKDLSNRSEFPRLKAYYRRVAELDAVKKALDATIGSQEEKK
jgi:nicotinamidase-related amidase